MDKYIIKDIKYIIINGKKYPWSPCDIEITQEEIRGGTGTFYKPKIKHIENADKESKWKKYDTK